MGIGDDSSPGTSHVTSPKKGPENVPESGPYYDLCKERTYIRDRIRRVYYKVTDETYFESFDDAKKKDFRDKLNYLKDKIGDLNESIMKIMPDSEYNEGVLIEEEDYEDKICEALSVLNPNPSHSEILRDAPIRDQTSNKLKLPTISMPEFSNDKTESLEKFLYAFECILSNHTLSEYEKYVYLRGQLRKAPLTLVNSLDAKNQTYQSAKDLLIEAFASTVNQQYDSIKRLSDLNLGKCGDVYNYISEMRNVISSFESLKIDVNTIIQFFVWHGLDDSFQSELIQITNNSKPSLDQINKNIFAATDRYLRNKNKYKSKNDTSSRTSDYKHSMYDDLKEPVKTNNFAVRVNGKSVRPCDLCSHDNNNVSHILRECKRYPNPTDKVNKLESLGFCGKCSFTNHKTFQCKFKFSTPCKTCQGPHMTFLCTGKFRTSNNLSYVYFNSNVENDSILLPSFTVKISNGGCNYVCRVLNDTGSQRNFISEEIASKLNLEVVENNIDMMINGFNTQKKVKTTIVLVPLLLHGEEFKINAIIVPSIDINLYIEQLPEIVSAFERSGLKLADEKLIDSNSNITNFGLIMGPDAMKYLCPKTVVFGDPSDSSVYLETKHGILLMGDTDKMLRNVDLHFDSPCVSTPEIPIDEATISDSGQTSRYKSTSTMTSLVHNLFDSKGETIPSKLQEVTDEALEQCGNKLLQYDCETNDLEFDELNNKIIDYVIGNTDHEPGKRLVMPLPWNPLCKQQLGKNFNLSKSILHSNLNKLKKDNRLTLYDEVFQEQEELGIIERIDDLDSFMARYPDCSFLPHMGVFKMKRETTKVRVVFLSNLCEKSAKQPDAVSHNNALLPGPCLNSKLYISLLLSRFDRYILIFDICKAFLSIALREVDQRKLLFLWFKSVKEGDFTLIAFKNLRLSFGLRSSPAILMIALYKMLILDVQNDDEDTVHLKSMIYNNMYMDNGLISSNDHDTLAANYIKIQSIFAQYKFSLQQFATNDPDLNSEIDQVNQSKSEPENDQLIKFFGIEWDKQEDSLSPFKLNLDGRADTKRKILSTLNSVYDLFNVYGPILNRSKLFFQKLQNDCALGWDDKISSDKLAEWNLICKQANATPKIPLQRFVGSRGSEYTLVAFSDSSSAIYVVVVYLCERSTGKTSYILSKNKVINTKLSKKTIPCLEFQGVSFATEVVIDLYLELGRDKNHLPVNIVALYVYTDSMVALSWIKGYFESHSKMQKKSVFVLNRLKKIGELCENYPVTYRYIEGKENPADYISRTVGYSKLCKTNYYDGPTFLQDVEMQPDIKVIVPGSGDSENFTSHILTTAVKDTSDIHQRRATSEHLTNLAEYSSLRKLTNIYVYILKFIHVLKRKVAQRLCPDEYVVDNEPNLISTATNVLLRTEQYIHFPEIFQFFESRNIPKSETPNLVLQMNLFIDTDLLLKVRGKCNKSPLILLPSNSILTDLFITQVHEKFSHVGVYAVLSELRKSFWILKGFSSVRRILKKCITCRKINERPIKVNQNNYKDFRSDPVQIPFSFVFLDYIGPINIKVRNEVTKVWILIVTCLWSRAISLTICYSADTVEFLRCLQIHIYSYGLFQLCLSDLGSQIIAGSNIVSKFLDDEECDYFFQNQGIKKVTFQQYAKGNSSLGSLVENCVKQVKFLMIKSIGKIILDMQQFQFLVKKTEHIINRRPVAFKEHLRTHDLRDEPFDPITPEMLIHGRELVSVGVIPQVHIDDSEDPEFLPTPDAIRRSYRNLRIASERLTTLYHNEFLVQLMVQSVDKKDRFRKVFHKKISVGDIVLLVEPHTKQSNYPMGIVREIEVNSLGEVSSAKVFKGKTRELVYRHASSLILLLQADQREDADDSHVHVSSDESSVRRPKRKAATKASKRIAALAS